MLIRLYTAGAADLSGPPVLVGGWAAVAVALALTLWFHPPAHLRRHHGMSGAEEFSRYAVGQLRAATARYPTDQALAALIGGLRAESREFAALWNSGDVPVGLHRAKPIDHPIAGHLELGCDVLTVPGHDQQVVLLTAAPGSASERALRRLNLRWTPGGLTTAATADRLAAGPRHPDG